MADLEQISQLVASEQLIVKASESVQDKSQAETHLGKIWFAELGVKNEEPESNITTEQMQDFLNQGYLTLKSRPIKK